MTPEERLTELGHALPETPRSIANYVGAVRTGNLEWLPCIWLGCYGAAVINGGQVSVAPVRYMGLCFVATAAAAAATPPDLGLAWLGVGFGWLHLVCGGYIAWRHNG